LYNPDMGFELQAFLGSLARELDDLSQMGLFRPDHITDGTWNQSSWLHSRVFGALVRAVQRPLVPLVEVGWSRNFYPDLCIIDNADAVQAVIEYESTNSSDERLIGKDIWHFEEAIIAQVNDQTELPPWWVLISTLPSCEVKRWPWYEWNTLTDRAKCLPVGVLRSWTACVPRRHLEQDHLGVWRRPAGESGLGEPR
jgi:hypothetical protein